MMLDDTSQRFHRFAVTQMVRPPRQGAGLVIHLTIKNH